MHAIRIPVMNKWKKKQTKLRLSGIQGASGNNKKEERFKMN
jgi:hypothetical protein